MSEVFSQVFKGIFVNQRNNSESPKLFLTAIPAGVLKEWVAVVPTRTAPGGVQRMLSDAHVKSIKNFISADSKNIIPTTITIALAEGRYVCDIGSDDSNLSILRIRTDSENQKPGILIDGQHRLEAFFEVDASIPLMCTIILGVDDLERALNFVVINNKAKRVPSDLVKAIVAEMPSAQQEIFKSRVRAVGLSLGEYSNALKILSDDGSSPFKDIVDWDINRNGIRLVKPLALEQSLRTLRNDLMVEVEIDMDEAIEIIAAMWRGVKTSDDYVRHWSAVDSKLLGKAGLVSTTGFLIEKLNARTEEGLIDVTNLGEVEAYCEEIMDKIPADFWSLDWDEKGLDTAVGHKLIRAAISQIRANVSRNAADPYAKVNILKQNGVDE